MKTKHSPILPIESVNKLITKTNNQPATTVIATSHQPRTISRTSQSESQPKIIASQEEPFNNFDINDTSPKKELTALSNKSITQSSTLSNGNVGEYENYIFKRLKCVNDLHGSLRSNLEKFSNLITECQNDYFKNTMNKLGQTKKDILKQISDLNILLFQKTFSQRTSIGMNNNNAVEKLKKLESLIFDQQCALEAGLIRKDDVFKYYTKETMAFSRVTMKILNELINQNKSLNKRCGNLFRLVNSNGGHHQQFMTSSLQESGLISSNNEVKRLKARVAELNDLLRSTSVRASRSPQDYVFKNEGIDRENIKSTFELKINSSYKKLSSIYGMINDKLSIYDDRVNSVEKLLEEKILFTRDMKQKTGARLLNDYIDKLKTQITDLQGRQSTLDIENKTLETDLKISRSECSSLQNINAGLTQKIENLLERKIDNGFKSLQDIPQLLAQQIKKVANDDETQEAVPESLASEDLGQLKDLRSELQNLKNENEDLKNRLQKLKDQKDADKAASHPNKKFEEEEKVKRSAFAKNKETPVDKDAEITKLTQELDEEKNQRVELSSKLEESRNKLKTIQEELDEAKENFEKEEASLKEEIDLCIDSINEKEKEVRDIKDEMERLREDLEEKNQEKKILNQEIITKEQLLIKTNCENEELKEELANLKEGGAPALTNTGEEPKATPKVTSENEDMIKELGDLRKTKMTLLEENEKLQNDYKEVKEKYERREQIYQALKAEYQNVLDEKEKLEDDVNYLEEEKNNLADEKKDFVKKIAEMKAEIIQFKKKAEKYKTELVEKETKLIVSMMDMDELKNQNSDYKRQINTQSMADLGAMLKFDENELQLKLNQIIDCEDLNEIKQKVSALFNELKSNQSRKKAPGAGKISPTMSIDELDTLNE